VPKLPEDKVMSLFGFTNKHLAPSVALGVLLMLPAAASAQVAGSTLIGVATAVDDIIVAPDKAVSYAIIGAGGFLGVARHDVAIPVSQLKLQDGKLVLPGATKEALKEDPEFEYASHKD